MTDTAYEGFVRLASGGAVLARRFVLRTSNLCNFATHFNYFLQNLHA